MSAPSRIVQRPFLVLFDAPIASLAAPREPPVGRSEVSLLIVKPVVVVSVRTRQRSGP
jgi:hypothetical protein